MTNYREILRLNNLGILKQDIAKALGCSRNTAANVIKLAEAKGIVWEAAAGLANNELSERVYSSPKAPRVHENRSTCPQKQSHPSKAETHLN